MSDPELVTEPNGSQGSVRAGGMNILELCKRLQRDGRWKEIEPVRDAMMRECRKKGMSKEDAQQWTYSELERLYLKPSKIVTSDINGEGVNSAASGDGAVEEATHARESSIPAGWPELPPNASLQAEIAWVQANRLDVVDGERIRLDRAKEPPPSRAALGWLETSIRSYAKYVEVAAKATATAADEQDQVRRERMVLAEVRALLAEMV